MIQLHFFTDEEKRVLLCKYYWELTENLDFAHQVKEIAQAFGVKSNEVFKLVQQNCAAQAELISCPHCGSKYQYRNREDFKQLLRSQVKTQVCDDCLQEATALKQAQEAARLKQKQETVRARFSLDKRRPMEIRAISFEDAVYFLSFVRLGVNEDFRFIRPLRSITDLFSPSRDFGFVILKQLYRNEVIYVHPESSLDSFEIQEDDSIQFFLDRVMWALPIKDDLQDSKKIVQELEQIFRNESWPEHWRGEALNLWKKIALQECFQYLEVVLAEHGFPFAPGEKTNLTFGNLLEEYSVAQMYNFIWRAAKDAASFYLRERVNKYTVK